MFCYVLLCSASEGEDRLFQTREGNGRGDWDQFPLDFRGLDAKFNRLERWVLALEPMSLELIRRPRCAFGEHGPCWQSVPDLLVQVTEMLNLISL